MLFSSTNPHLITSLTQLSRHRKISAAEDIYDDRGTKLWARGHQVTDDLQEKLLRRRLAKPLETALAVEGALSFSDIIRSIETLTAGNPLLNRLAGHAALRLLRSLESFPIPAPIRLLLTSAQVNDAHTFQHTVFAVLILAGIASRLDISEHDAQTLLAAGLLHDIGEMYINPEYLKTANRLAPHEWKHVASHPRIGELLIREMTTLPAAVAQIVGQHHERLDGSGYPFQAGRQAQHPLSNWLAVADTASAILARGDAAGAPQQIALALRIVPEEFDREVVGAMISALHDDANHGYGGAGDVSCISRAQSAWRHIDAAIVEIDRLGASSQAPLVSDIAGSTRHALVTLGKSLRATGAIETDQLGEDINDRELLCEICLVTQETNWRLRNLARNIHLRAEYAVQAGAVQVDLAVLAPLIALLNDADSALPPAMA